MELKFQGVDSFNLNPFSRTMNYSFAVTREPLSQANSSPGIEQWNLDGCFSRELARSMVGEFFSVARNRGDVPEVNRRDLRQPRRHSFALDK
jgi:hypothetical protein